MNFKTIQDALYTWFNGATGLTTIWADQRTPRPAKPYGVLKLLLVKGLGHDEVRTTYDADADPGEEIDRNIAGIRGMTLSCQVFSDSQGPTAHATYYLSKALTSLKKESVLAALRTAEIAVERAEPVRNLDAVASESWESRASFDVLLWAPENEADNATTYIGTVEVSGTAVNGEDIAIAFDVAPEEPA